MKSSRLKVFLGFIFSVSVNLFIFIGYLKTGKVELIIPMFFLTSTCLFLFKGLMRPPTQIIISKSGDILLYKGGVIGNKVDYIIPLNSVSQFSEQVIRRGDFYVRFLTISLGENVNLHHKHFDREKMTIYYPLNICKSSDLVSFIDSANLLLAKSTMKSCP